AVALVTLCYLRRCRVGIAMAVPVALSALAILSYNYARFQDPLEFGIRYQLVLEKHLQHLPLSAANLYPGLFYMLFCPPSLSPVFPFVHLPMRLPPTVEALPLRYFLEPTAGALLIAPVILGVVFTLRRAHRSCVLSAATAAALTAVLALLFVAALGVTTQRYQLDFVPLLAIAALIAMVAGIAVSDRWRRGLTVALIIAGSWSIFTNAALGITGPYDDVLQRRPESWLRVARAFSFSEKHTPLLNPRVTIRLRFSPETTRPGARDPLVVLGRHAHRWLLYIERESDRLLLVSETTTGMERQPIPHTQGPVSVRAEFDPASRVMATTVNGMAALNHRLDAQVVAPSQIQFGQNNTVPLMTARRFDGMLEVMEYTIR
ncbi:MAG TPA: hypothetical protein VES20_18305, partial [Bryobacteraceae bacterium]|nr:hypothetical protein [Bryobacteraceae bacterium]